MRVVFVPPTDKQWIQHYVNQQNGKGFSGIPYQRGNGLGSLFRGLFRVLLPVVKSAGRAVGKQALRTGAQIASDLVAGESLKSSVENRGRRGASNLLKKAAAEIKQQGKGIGARKEKPVKRKAPTKKKTPVKRKAPAAKGIKGAKKTKMATSRDQFGVYFK